MRLTMELEQVEKSTKRLIVLEIASSLVPIGQSTDPILEPKKTRESGINSIKSLQNQPDAHFDMAFQSVVQNVATWTADQCPSPHETHPRSQCTPRRQPRSFTTISSCISISAVMPCAVESPRLGISMASSDPRIEVSRGGGVAVGS